MSKDCLPPHLKDKLHWDWIWPFSRIPRSWTAFCWGKPTKLFGNQHNSVDGHPKPVGEPGSWQISYFPGAPWWALKGLYLAFTGAKGRHWRVGARWDDVDLYTQWPSIATRKFPLDGDRDTST